VTDIDPVFLFDHNELAPIVLTNAPA